MTTDATAEFKVERYKFILQEIHFLNENIHRYLALFQALITAIVGGGVGLFVTWRNLGISADVARVGIQGLLGVLFILTAFVVIQIFIGVFSWFDYRNEEVALLSQVTNSQFRSAPTLRNFWRWHETYLALFIIAIAVTIFVFVQNQVLPLIK